MIRLDDVHFSFGPKPILDGAAALVPEGARAGLIGRNGAGKTTIFRLILGDLEPVTGDIRVARDRRVAYLPQEPDLPAAETILHHVLASHPVLRDMEDELLRLERAMADEADPGRLDRIVERHRALSRQFEARGGHDLEARVAGILEGLGFGREDLLAEIGPLSPGEKNRVALAKVLLADADLYLLDEPTNHLDFEMVEWFERFLSDPPPGASGARPTALVASHDRYFLNRFADRIYELRDGRLHSYRGNYDAFALQRAEEAERLEKEYRLRQADVARDLEFIRRNFAGQKARQAKSREKRLSRLEPVERPAREAAGPRIRFGETAPLGERVLRLHDVDCGYPGAPVLISGITLDLERGERAAVLGPNGCGKTTLLGTIAGTISPLSGAVEPGPRTVIGYHEQEAARSGSDKSVFEEVHDIVPRWTNQEVRDLLAAFAFRGDEIHSRTDSLSGGERARVALIRLILSGANLLLLDEPTNHLDVYARAALEEGLADFPGTILFVSHDRYFVERVAGRVLAVEEGRLRERPGGYEEYAGAAAEARRRRAAEADRARSTARAAARGPRRGSAPGGEAPRSRAEEERLVKAIARLEEDLRARQAACGLEEHYRNPDAMRRLKQEIAGMEERLRGLYRSWEDLLAGGKATGD